MIPPKPRIREQTEEIMVSWTEKLEQAKMKIAAPTDPWLLPLARLRGKVSDDGIERIASQAVLDFLEVPQRSRGAGACRRLAKLMRKVGWRPIKARGLNQRGLLEQIRGYARDRSGSPLS
jgi:hypothetical protein